VDLGLDVLCSHAKRCLPINVCRHSDNAYLWIETLYKHDWKPTTASIGPPYMLSYISSAVATRRMPNIT
jgi:hypothetical protein